MNKTELKLKGTSDIYRSKLFTSKKRYQKAIPTKQRSDLKLQILIGPKYRDVLERILKK